jgi:hypothetical protein
MLTNRCETKAHVLFTEGRIFELFLAFFIYSTIICTQYTTERLRTEEMEARPAIEEEGEIDIYTKLK